MSGFGLADRIRLRRRTSAPGANNDWNFDVRLDDSSTGIDLSCTISDGATTCSNTAAVIYINPGDAVNVQIFPNSNPVAANFDWSASIAPPAAVYP